MFKKLALLLMLLIPVLASQALSFTIVSLNNVTSTNGTCLAGDMIFFFMSAPLTSTVDDGGDFDWMTIVLYDGYGTVIGTSGAGFPIGTSANLPILGLGFLTSPQARPFTLKFFDTPGFQSAEIAAHSPLLGSLSFDPVDYGLCDFLPVYVPTPEGSVPHFHDGRINNFDMASPIVVYGHDFEDGRGLVVYSPEGELLLAVHPEAFAVECSGETIELASENRVTLYLLESCEYQLMAKSLDGTKNYVLIFNEPYANTGYRSYEE